MMRIGLLALILSLFCGHAGADIYKVIDEKGIVRYSNTPVDGAVKISQKSEWEVVENKNGGNVGWVMIGENEDFTAYANRSTIRKSGSNVKMWARFDFKHHSTAIRSNGRIVMSMKNHFGFNCIEEKSITLDTTFFSKIAGYGDVISTWSNTDKWEPIPPDSTIESLWGYACTEAISAKKPHPK